MKCGGQSSSPKEEPRGIWRGKRSLLLSSWLNLDRSKRPQWNALFALNRRILKAYLLEESLSQLWNYTYEGAMLRYLQSWIDQLRRQRVIPMETLARMLLDHLVGILNYCRTKVPMGITARCALEQNRCVRRAGKRDQ
jgi:transposase